MFEVSNELLELPTFTWFLEEGRITASGHWARYDGGVSPSIIYFHVRITCTRTRYQQLA
jgi:hypothetical protein